MSQPLFLGIDLAWGSRNRTGLAVVDDSGRLVASGTAVSDDDIATWLRGQPGHVVVAAVDAPLVVPNETGQRVGENLVAKAFGRYGAAPYPSNRANPLFDPPRAWKLAERFGWSVDPAGRGSVEGLVCIEVYPHPAMVGLFGLATVLPYKAGRGRTPEARRAVFADLLGHLESIEPLGLAGHPRWVELRAAVDGATRQMHLELIEDELDAILCAHLAWLWHHRLGALRVYGTLETGYVVAPPPPAHSAPSRDSIPISRRLVALAVDVVGRPTGFAGGDHEQRWKAAVRDAFAGMSLPPDCRVSVEIEFRLDPTQVDRNAPDLDNLIKATIDALEGVLGLRRGNWAHAQADDGRVDRIAASKQVARKGEASGARVGSTNSARQLHKFIHEIASWLNEHSYVTLHDHSSSGDATVAPARGRRSAGDAWGAARGALRPSGAG